MVTKPWYVYQSRAHTLHLCLRKTVRSLSGSEVVEPEAAGFESVGPPHRAANCQLSEDHKDPQGEGL